MVKMWIEEHKTLEHARDALNEELEALTPISTIISVQLKYTSNPNTPYIASIYYKLRDKGYFKAYNIDIRDDAWK